MTARPRKIDVRAVRDISGKAVIWVVLLAVVLMNMLPFFWAIFSSLKPNSEIQSENPSLLPRTWTLENYRGLWDRMSGFGYYYRNSLLVTAATVGLALLVGSLAAYAFARFRFPGNNVLFYMLVFTMFLPGEIGLIGQFELFFKLHLLDKLTGLILSYTAGSMALVLFIMRNVFKGIPQDMLDAARIDGAGTWHVFWEIMVPLSKTGLVAAGIMVALGAWNEFLFAVTMTWSGRSQTLPVGINMLRDQFQLWDYGLLFASVMLSFLPVMVLFILLQKQFIKGATAGAIKG